MNTEPLLEISSPHGIIGPRSNGFTIRGVQFFEYNWKNAAALGTCSHCFHPAATDSGARTVRISNVEFTGVEKRIKYQVPYRGIFLDLDGTLTGKGAKTFATFAHEWNKQPECDFDSATILKYNGVVCDNTV